MRVDRERMDAFLNRIRGPVCPLCGNSNWTAADTVFQAIEFDYKGVMLGGASMPIVPITCTQCGNTHMINALVAGIIDREVPDERQTETNAEGKTLEK